MSSGEGGESAFTFSLCHRLSGNEESAAGRSAAAFAVEDGGCVRTEQTRAGAHGKRGEGSGHTQARARVCVSVYLASLSTAKKYARLFLPSSLSLSPLHSPSAAAWLSPVATALLCTERTRGRERAQEFPFLSLSLSLARDRLRRSI